MNIYRTSPMLKTLARGQLLGNYRTVVGALLTYLIMRGVLESAATILTDQSTFFGVIVYYIISFIISLITGIFGVGEAYLYLKLICNQPIKASDIFYGFRYHTDKALKIQLFFTSAYYLCMLPGILIAYLPLPFAGRTLTIAYYLLTSLGFAVYFIILLFYSQSYYLLLDFPSYQAKDILKLSRKIMQGQKGRLLYINVSFLPLVFIGFLSFGLSFLWSMPYINATFANFYMDLIQKREHAAAP